MPNVSVAAWNTAKSGGPGRAMAATDIQAIPASATRTAGPGPTPTKKRRSSDGRAKAQARNGGGRRDGKREVEARDPADREQGLAQEERGDEEARQSQPIDQPRAPTRTTARPTARTGSRNSAMRSTTIDGPARDSAGRNSRQIDEARRQGPDEQTRDQQDQPITAQATAASGGSLGRSAAAGRDSPRVRGGRAARTMPSAPSVTAVAIDSPAWNAAINGHGHELAEHAMTSGQRTPHHQVIEIRAIGRMAGSTMYSIVANGSWIRSLVDGDAGSEADRGVSEQQAPMEPRPDDPHRSGGRPRDRDGG